MFRSVCELSTSVLVVVSRCHTCNGLFYPVLSALDSVVNWCNVLCNTYQIAAGICAEEEYRTITTGNTVVHAEMVARRSLRSSLGCIRGAER